MNLMECGKNVISTARALVKKKRAAGDASPVLIALDGRSGAGKSTFAGYMNSLYRIPIIAMDDFFLQESQRTEERYAKTGENVDHERFLAEVLIPLKEAGKATYRPFLADTMEFDDPITVEGNDIIIIDGPYSMHPDLVPYYDLKYFLTIDPVAQKARLIEREGKERTEEFIEKWLPLEEAYIREYDIEHICDAVLDFHK